MSKAARLAAALASSRPDRDKHGLEMSDVENVAIDALDENPLNALFPEESEKHLQTLRNDIAERGVLTPLQALPVERKRDGTPVRGRLISGHNRLAIARELGFKTVPTQWIDQELSEEQERHAVIKDNLLRRHLRLDDRVRLYAAIYGEAFAELLREHGRAGRKADGEESLIARIAEDTGQAKETVKKQIQRARKKPEGKKPGAKNERRAGDSNGDNVPIEDALRTLRRCMQQIAALGDNYDDVARLLNKVEAALEKRFNER